MAGDTGPSRTSTAWMWGCQPNCAPWVVSIARNQPSSPYASCSFPQWRPLVIRPQAQSLLTTSPSTDALGDGAGSKSADTPCSRFGWPRSALATPHQPGDTQSSRRSMDIATLTRTWKHPHIQQLRSRPADGCPELPRCRSAIPISSRSLGSVAVCVCSLARRGVAASTVEPADSACRVMVGPGAEELFANYQDDGARRTGKGEEARARRKEEEEKEEEEERAARGAGAPCSPFPEVKMRRDEGRIAAASGDETPDNAGNAGGLVSRVLRWVEQPQRITRLSMVLGFRFARGEGQERELLALVLSGTFPRPAGWSGGGSPRQISRRHRSDVAL